METFRNQHKNVEFSGIEKPTDFFETHKDHYDGFWFLLKLAVPGLYTTPVTALSFPNRLRISYAEAFAVSGRNADFLDFINQWIKAQEINGFKAQNYDFWILGKAATEKGSRWCLGKDIFQLW